MAALSRETFVVLPLALDAGVLLRGIVPSLNAAGHRVGSTNVIRAAIWHAIPVLAFFGLADFIRQHFHKGRIQLVGVVNQGIGRGRLTAYRDSSNASSTKSIDMRVAAQLAADNSRCEDVNDKRDVHPLLPSR